MRKNISDFYQDRLISKIFCAPIPYRWLTTRDTVPRIPSPADLHRSVYLRLVLSASSNTRFYLSTRQNNRPPEVLSQEAKEQWLLYGGGAGLAMKIGMGPSTGAESSGSSLSGASMTRTTASLKHKPNHTLSHSWELPGDSRQDLLMELTEEYFKKPTVDVAVINHVVPPFALGTLYDYESDYDTDNARVLLGRKTSRRIVFLLNDVDVNVVVAVIHPDGKVFISTSRDAQFDGFQSNYYLFTKMPSRMIPREQQDGGDSEILEFDHWNLGDDVHQHTHPDEQYSPDSYFEYWQIHEAPALIVKAEIQAERQCLHCSARQVVCHCPREKVESHYPGISSYDFSLFGFFEKLVRAKSAPKNAHFNIEAYGVNETKRSSFECFAHGVCRFGLENTLSFAKREFINMSLTNLSVPRSINNVSWLSFKLSKNDIQATPQLIKNIDAFVETILEEPLLFFLKNIMVEKRQSKARFHLMNSDSVYIDSSSSNSTTGAQWPLLSSHSSEKTKDEGEDEDEDKDENESHRWPDGKQRHSNKFIVTKNIETAALRKKTQREVTQDKLRSAAYICMTENTFSSMVTSARKFSLNRTTIHDDNKSPRSSEELNVDLPNAITTLRIEPLETMKYDGSRGAGVSIGPYRNSPGGDHGGDDYEKTPCNSRCMSNGTKPDMVSLVNSESLPVEFRCPVCVKSFRKASLLNRHINSMHNSSRKYVCSNCSCGFISLGHLKEHVRRIHEKTFDFACDLCQGRYASRGDLRKHVICVHEKLKNFKCDLCDKSFARKYDLKRHMGRMHETR